MSLRINVLPALPQDKHKDPYPVIEKPTTDNKADIFNWIYKESRNIHSLLCDKLWELTGLSAEYPNIWFRVKKNKDKLFFSVNHLSEWKQFEGRLLLETFSLEPRLEKLNKYEFDEEDMKRINKSIERNNGLNEPKSNLEMAHYFDGTDKLLAAYYYREFLNIFLFKFLRTKTLDEMTPEEREAERERREKYFNETLKSLRNL
ncbi:MAG: hypothetical protein ACXVNF_07195 [Neobacillus sp.]